MTLEHRRSAATNNDSRFRAINQIWSIEKHCLQNEIRVYDPILHARSLHSPN